MGNLFFIHEIHKKIHCSVNKKRNGIHTTEYFIIYRAQNNGWPQVSHQHTAEQTPFW